MPVDRDAIWKAMKGVDDSFNEVANQLDAVEKCNDQRAITLEKYGCQLDARAASLDEREKEIANKSAALDQIVKVAADRKCVIETLKQNQVALKNDADKARAERKLTLEEKVRLEKVVATLLAEKKNISDAYEKCQTELAKALGSVPF